MSPQRKVVIGASLAAAIVIAVACSPDPEPETTTTGLVAHEECSLVKGALRGERAQALEDTMANWTTWAIPEYQDAQRFVPTPVGDFGPLACIVANPKLGAFTADSFALGAVAAIIYVDGSAPVTNPYSALKLTSSGFYCLRLFGDVTHPVMAAHVVKSVAKVCGDTSSSTRIHAFPAQTPATTVTDYPAVARWVMMQSLQPGIGLRCLDRWCSVGIPNLAAIDPPAQGTLSSTAPGYVRHTVLGWFDQQHIAVPDPAKPFGLRPVLKASVVPDDGLGGYTLGTFAGITHVADVYFSDTPAPTKYGSTWRFTNGKNTLSLDTTTANGWRVYVNGTYNPNLKVIHTPHSTPVIGTARWAWKDNDEGIWVRCAQGCCKVEEI